MDELTAKAYVSWGLWVADCPRPHCLGSEHLGHAPITGIVGGLTLQGFRCARCQLVCRAEYPPNAEDIWYVLSLRPVTEVRSWHLGETLEDLIVQNAEHGILPPGIERDGITILDGRITDRTLVATGSKFAIGA